jgi:hypothetical protein
MYAMKAITDNLLPERWEKSRTPPSKAELSSTSILRVRIESASAKVRVGGPSEERSDLKNDELVKNTWTGVVRFSHTFSFFLALFLVARSVLDAYSDFVA